MKSHIGSRALKDPELGSLASPADERNDPARGLLYSWARPIHGRGATSIDTGQRRYPSSTCDRSPEC